MLSDGTVSCWDGTYGGYPDWASGWSAPASPVLQPMLSDVAQFASLRSGDMPGPAECARLHDGTVTCRGNNDLGTLGDGASVPDMTTTAPSDDAIRRYLLGSLSEADESRLEDAYLADPGLAARIEGVQHDLVDDYVTGALDAADRARFESYYLTTSARCVSGPYMTPDRMKT